MASLWGFRPRGLGRSAPETAAYFAHRNGITAPPTKTELPHRRGCTSVARTDYRQPDKLPDVLFTVTGGGHVIPNATTRGLLLGRVSRDLVVADEMADFLGL